MTLPVHRPDNPVFLFVPYLAMTEPAEFGPWWLGPAAEFNGTWHSDRFRELAIALLSAFKDADGEALENPALLAYKENGVDGEMPDSNELIAVQRAINFTVLDRNPAWNPALGNEGLWTSSSDNAEVFLWPLDLEHESITLTRGAMIRVQAGGYRISNDLVIGAPKELWLPWPRPLDGELLEAVYQVMRDQQLGDREFAARIGVAIDWLAQAWRNSPSITFEQRVVMLKTAFDALTNHDKTHLAATWLEERFRSLEAIGVDDRHAEDLLWAPSEQPVRTRNWGQGKSELCTDLVHWFNVLGATRNEIVHEGAAASLTYEEDGSDYSGPLPNIAERVLRETIRVCLRDFGFADLWEPAIRRSIRRKLEEAFAVLAPEEE